MRQQSGLVDVCGEALATPTFNGGVGINEGKCFAQAAFTEVDTGPIDQGQAVCINEDAYAVLFKDAITFALFAR